MASVTALVLAASLALGSGASLVPDPQIKGKAGDGVMDIIAHRSAREGQGAERVASVRRASIMVPACPGNEPVRGLLDAGCAQALALCAGTATANDVMIWIFSGPAGVSRPGPGQWSRVGQRCMTMQEAGRGQGVPVLSARDFRRLPLPPGRAKVQPPTLRTLVNVPTNVFVDAPVATLDVTLLGAPVRVRATPSRFRWSFGDGAVLTTSDPGAAYPDLRTTHTYSTPGPARLQLVTTYSGEYSVAGGPWLPIDGTADVSSPPVTVTVVSARNELIGG